MTMKMRVVVSRSQLRRVAVRAEPRLRISPKHVELYSTDIRSSVAGAPSTGIDKDTVIAIICVGVIVLLIIVGQSIALLYFKSRAQRQNRLDTLVTRDTYFDRNDEARYSAPPSRRNTKTNRANGDTDSHIYEMVGINALYKESSELDIKNRPPLPLPGAVCDGDSEALGRIAHRVFKECSELLVGSYLEQRASIAIQCSNAASILGVLESAAPPPIDNLPQSPAPPPIDSLPRSPKSKLLSSTLSLNSVGSNKTLPAKLTKKEQPPASKSGNKAPCRPPKQVDEARMIGSLPRPPKPLPLTKGGSTPKLLSTDPALLELKKALERRNIQGQASSSPSPSQQSTLEMKPKPAPVGCPPPVENLPGGGQQPPNVKLLLPKIEATLRPPPPAKPSKAAEVSTLRPAEPTASAKVPPSIQQKPGVPPFRRPSAEAKAPPSAPVPLRLPPPQVQTSRPLLPIHPEEDEGHNSDEEWTYEKLEKYNIYK